MITKERLEELIEQGATIYVYNRKYIGCCSLKNAFDCDDEILYLDDKDDGEIEYLTNLFETKEDAEEYAEFGNITRTEKLTLPSWEEFSKWDKSVKFYNKQNKYSMYVFVKNKNTNNCRIIIYADDGEQDWIVFQQPLSKENYDEARRLCVKLFKGEEV